MATLSGNKIKNTYQSLVKFSDNGNITTSAKQLTDGFGNNSPMFVSTTQVGIGVTPESGLNLHVFGDAKIGSNLTVIGNLVVEGSTTTVGTDTLTVKDPLIVLANNNTSTDAVDIGFYGKYTPSGTTLYSGLFREALTGKYRLFKGLEVEPTTTVNTSGTGYAVATLIANLEGNVTGNLIGSVTGGTFSGTLLSNVVATTQSANDNSTKVATTAYVDNQVGLYDTLSEVLVNGNTTGGTDIAVTANDNITFVDDSKAIFGTDGDLEIYHFSTTDQAFISINGELDIRANTLSLKSYVGETMLRASSNGTVRLYYDGVEKLQTTSTGISVTGDVDFTGNINIGDNQKILFGDGGDIEMFFNGSTFVIDDTVEVFGFDIDTNLIRFRGTDLYTEISNGQHTFWTNGTERFKINATEVKVSHQLNVTGDLIVDTDTLFVDASEDSVGIGLTNPSDYSADELVISVPDDSGMTLVSGTTDTAYIRFADGTAAADQANFISHDHSTDTLTIFSQDKVSIGILEAEVAYFTNTNFYVDKSTTIDDNLFVDGNVGIGTNSPVVKLAVKSSQEQLTLSEGDFRGATFDYRSSTGNLNIATNGINARTNPQFTLDLNGNIGIGTDSPNVKLQITGNSTNSLLLDSINGALGQNVFFNGSAWDSVNHSVGGSIMQLGTDGSFAFRRATAANPPVLTYSMYIDSNGKTGIGTASPAQKLDVVGKMKISDDIILAQTNGRIDYDNGVSTGALRFHSTSGNAERMRITSSGNVGIGTTSPTSKLQVANAGEVIVRSSMTAADGYRGGFEADNQHTGGTIWSMFSTNNSDGYFGGGKYVIANESMGGVDANTTAKFVIDGSGNVGIGTDSPNAKLDVHAPSTTAPSLTMGAAAGQIFKNENLEFAFGLNNASPYNGYMQTRFVSAPYYRDFAINPLGGNVGIGTNSPATKLHVVGTIKLGGYSYIGEDLSDQDSLTIASDHTEAIHFAHFTPATSTYSTNMIIDSSGNVGIGTTSPDLTGFGYNTLTVVGGTTAGYAGVLELGSPTTNANGQNLGIIAFMDGSTRNAQIDVTRASSTSTSNMHFYTNGGSGIVERMRVIDTGYIKARGRYTTSYEFPTHTFHSFEANESNEPTMVLFNDTTSTAYGLNVINGTDHNNTSSRFFLGQGGSTERIKIFSNGNIANTNNSYTALSDIKLKENIEDATPKLDELMQVRIRNYNLIGEELKQIGVVAQELEEVFPALVYETPDTERQDINKTDEEGNIIYQIEKVLTSEAVEGQEAIEWEDKPTINNTKFEIQTWLDDNNIEWQSADTKQELLDRISEYKQEAIEAQDAVYETRETDIPETINKEVDLGTTTKAVKYSIFVPIMIKAMQEQQQIINDLKSRIETLENN